MTQVIEDVCSCGEPISVEIGCTHRVARTDKKRPFYPDRTLPEGVDTEKYSIEGMTVFRCRKCGECVDETVPSAAFDN